MKYVDIALDMCEMFISKRIISDLKKYADDNIDENSNNLLFDKHVHIVKSSTPIFEIPADYIGQDKSGLRMQYPKEQYDYYTLHYDRFKQIKTIKIPEFFDGYSYTTLIPRYHYPNAFKDEMIGIDNNDHRYERFYNMVLFIAQIINISIIETFNRSSHSIFVNSKLHPSIDLNKKYILGYNNGLSTINIPLMYGENITRLEKSGTYPSVVFSKNTLPILESVSTTDIYYQYKITPLCSVDDNECYFIYHIDKKDESNFFKSNILRRVAKNEEKSSGH